MKKLLVFVLIGITSIALAQEVKQADDVPEILGPGPAPTGGPDAFGYVFADSTTAECTNDFIDITETGTSVVSGDDAAAPVDLPGPDLDFYGETVTDIAMATNGYLSTDPADTGPDLSNDCPLPAVPSTGGGGRYYPLQDDLITADGLFEYFPVCPRDSGAVAGEGCYVFQWNGTEHFGGGGETFSFQAVLYDTSYAIVYQFGAGNPEEGAGSTTGIQNLAADDGLTYACDVPTPVTAGGGSACFYHPDFPFGSEADLAITKTGAATAIAGSQATYTIQVTNNGPFDAQGVSVTDTPPAGFSFASATAPCTGGFPCALGTVADGDSVSFDVTFDIAASTTPGDFTNTAAVTTTSSDPDTGNNSADATTTVSAEADLAITKTGAATAIAGTQATYTIQVTNNGPSDAQGVSVTDTPPAGFSFASAMAPCTGGFPCALGTVAAGDSVSFDVTFDIAADVTGEVTNTAAATTSTTDPDTGNNSAAAITSVSAEADLSILKVGDVTAPVGGQTTYTIEVSNAGPSVATGVVITDNLPTGQTLVSSTGCAEDPAGAPTCTVGTLAPGASATVTLTVSLDGSGGAEQTNTASVASAATDPSAANNTDSAVIFVIFQVPTLNLLGLTLLMLALLTLGLVTVRRMN